MYQLVKIFSENFSSFCVIIEGNIEEGGKPENLEENPRSKDENQQQTQPTYGSGNWTYQNWYVAWSKNETLISSESKLNKTSHSTLEK